MTERLCVAITGASAGIGLELARAFGDVDLVLNARDGAALEAARASLSGARVELVAGDVTEAAVQREIVARAEARFGRLDVLVNNAGRGYYARFADIDAGELAKLFALNVLAPVSLTQLALPLLEASRGAVVMVSSVAGVAAAPAMGAYAATKFALEAVSTSLRAEVAARGVRVLVVRPGPTSTGFRDHAASSGSERLVTPEKDDRQPAADVAERIVRAVRSGQEVLETSLYVRGVSLVSRVLPPVFRFATQRLARQK